MRPEELGIGGEIAQILAETGITDLYPTQEMALPHVLKGRNVVAAVPTASGKSLIGYIALLRAAMAGQKGMYIVPLKALANEKYEELSRFSRTGASVAVSTGDLDSKGERLGNNSIIVATSEKADSLLRHSAPWIRELSVLVVDEIHMINDPDRGPTLEMVIARLRKIVPNIQIIGLSATIKNSAEIAEWLEAEHVQSDWRPVQLKVGTYCEGELFFTNNERRLIDNSPDDLWPLIEDSVKNGGQALVFVNTRKSTETVALRYGSRMRKLIGPVTKEIEFPDEDDGDESNTHLSKMLLDSIQNGITFHHAGLTGRQRSLVERLFKQGNIKCLVATPTLAAGINLPARTVIIRDIYRYDAHTGNTLIPVAEIKQMLGRAGRPSYDDYGEAVIIAKSAEQASLILDEYLLGESEGVNSQIGNERSLRTHVLSAFSTRVANSVDELRQFFSFSFFSFRNDLSSLEESLNATVSYLEGNGMIAVEGESIRATTFGKRVSDLYIDPLSAVMMRDAIVKFTPGKELGFLHSVCSTPDIIPLYCRSSEVDELNDIAENRKSELLQQIDSAEDTGLYLSQLKTALLLKDWMSEDTEEQILERYGIYPGDLRSKAETATWLVSSAAELASVMGSDSTQQLELLALRMEKGVSENLLDLATIRMVGRNRALTLYRHNFRTRREVAAADEETLAALPGFGRNIARRIIENARRSRKVVRFPQKDEIPQDWFFNE
jgi:helicase